MSSTCPVPSGSYSSRVQNARRSSAPRARRTRRASTALIVEVSLSSVPLSAPAAPSRIPPASLPHPSRIPPASILVDRLWSSPRTPPATDSGCIPSIASAAPTPPPPRPSNPPPVRSRPWLLPPRRSPIGDRPTDRLTPVVLRRHRPGLLTITMIAALPWMLICSSVFLENLVPSSVLCMVCPSPLLVCRPFLITVSFCQSPRSASATHIQPSNPDPFASRRARVFLLGHEETLAITL